MAILSRSDQGGVFARYLWFLSLCVALRSHTPSSYHITLTGTSYSSDLPAKERILAAGQLFSLLLGPSCTALAFRIFQQQKNVADKLPAVLCSSVRNCLVRGLIYSVCSYLEDYSSVQLLSYSMPSGA